MLASIVLIQRAGREPRGVLLMNQEFGARFLERQDPYFDPKTNEREHGPYPPSYVWLCAPLSKLPTPIARRVWCGAQILALWTLFAVLRRRSREHVPELAAHAPMIFLFALLLASRYVLRDTKAGGGNLLYGTLAVVGLDLALRGRTWLAGLPIALGMVLKPNLAMLLVFLLPRARRKALVSTVLFGAVLFVAPALYYGVEAYAQLVAHWVRDVVGFSTLTDLHDSTIVPDGMPAAKNAMNQSLRESMHRLLRPPGDTGAFDVHLVTVPAAVAVAISSLVGLTLLAGTVWRALRARGARAEWLGALALLPVSLLLSPVTWKAHHAVLVPLFYVLVELALQRRLRPRWLVGGLWLYWLLCDFLSVEVVGDRAGDWLQAVSIVPWFDVLLVLACWVAIGRLSERGGSPDSGRGAAAGEGEEGARDSSCRLSRDPATD